jgi:hypothetical protein
MKEEFVDDFIFSNTLSIFVHRQQFLPTVLPEKLDCWIHGTTKYSIISIYLVALYNLC